MPGHRGRASRATAVARLAVLSLLLAGFLSMHGFLAVSASAETHAEAQATFVDVADPSHGAHAAASGPASTGALPEPGEGVQAPAEHHGVLAGCVVALVGVALLSVAAVAAWRRRPVLAGRVDRLAAAVRQVVVARPVGWTSPRISLCVIRV